MSNEFDFDAIKKRMPYTTPDDFFEKLEEDIWNEVKGEFKETQVERIKPISASIAEPRRSRWAVLMRGAIAVAASVALVLAINLNTPKAGKASLNEVDKAFSQLTADDQAYLLSVYHEDVFLSE